MLLHECRTMLCDRLAEHERLAPSAKKSIALRESRERAQQGGLAALYRPHEHVYALGGQVQIDAGEHDACAEGGAPAAQRQHIGRRERLHQTADSSSGIAMRALVSAMPRLAVRRQTNTAT